jgi:DNA excision repair protein ERCC-2
MGVGEFSAFMPGPREAAGGPAGLWRAQLGSRWHRELRERAAAEDPGARFEVVIEGSLAHRGWTLELSGRMDQVASSGGVRILREVKSVLRPLPGPEAELRADHPDYFVQLAAYAALASDGAAPARAELVFVSCEGGMVQVVPLGADDGLLLRAQLDRVADFLDLRLRSRDRLRSLDFSPPFEDLRPGQEEARRGLAEAVRGRHGAILLDAPTGFGKTGIVLEFALGELRLGHFERMIYLTGKSTGQIQVVRTLSRMAGPGLATWQVRAKAEHCVNSAFHCVRGACGYIEDVASRWKAGGLSRFYLFDNQARDLESLREAGRAAAICPYEITRAALPFNEVWIGDYNYVFAPANSPFFLGQPGFDAARTLLVVDEAHNLAARAADAHSRRHSADEAAGVLEALHRAHAPAPLLAAWRDWSDFLRALEPAGELPEDMEEEAREHLLRLAGLISSTALDPVELGPAAGALLWEIPAWTGRDDGPVLPMLWWCPRPGELAVTCLDAAAAVGQTLGSFGGVVLATATPGPTPDFAASVGLAAGDGSSGTVPLLVRIEASTPWRNGAYDVACDERVDTSFRHRASHYALTASTVAALARGAPGTAVFFPSYAYAEEVLSQLSAQAPAVRAVLQPRLAGLAAQAAWIEESLASSDALFLVLGSSFSESVDMLGGRVTRAMVVGPALPEVNPVQRARIDSLMGGGRDAAFRRVYRIPGMQKVNQALGRLVRAPGHRARVLLHCRRFILPEFSGLLAADLRPRRLISSEYDLEKWLADAV